MYPGAKLATVNSKKKWRNVLCNLALPTRKAV